MKKIFIFLVSASFASFAAHSQTFKNIGDRVKDKAAQRANQKADQAIDKGLDKTEESINNAGKTSTAKKTTQDSQSTAANQTSSNKNIKKDTIPAATPAALKVYQNYDFIPGQTVLFEDDFSTDAIGEFGSHWELQAGQAVVNKVADKSALLITDGNSGWVTPLMKKKKYLNKEWTLEFDYYKNDEAYGIKIFLQDESHNDLGKIGFSNNDAYVTYLTSDDSASKDLLGNYPAEMGGENFINKWHHIAIAYKDKQIKVYVDQSRVVVVPNSNLNPAILGLGGIGSQDGPLTFTNVRIADGAGMNMLGKKFTDTKIITHGINFDVNKAIIKPESMGTLNGIVQIMKDNPEVKFEVGGHTDADGDDATNLKLSQGRADAVRNELIAMGVTEVRLTTKGYGETKPISDNNTLEGKANNRRVEFVKK